MKQKLPILFILLVSIFTGCKKNQEEAQPINVNVQLGVDPAKVWFEVPYEKAEITLINKSNNSKYTLKANHQGQIALQSIVPGVYSINVSLKITAAEFLALTGTTRESDYYLNYSLDNQSYFTNADVKIQLINSEVIGGFVIKQIYYAGSDPSTGAIFRDQFIEVYNNTSETLYADSLMIAVVYGKISKNVDNYSLTNNQYDWSKSIGMAATGNANEDYIYVKELFMIPSDGTGKKYPVLTGKSIVIAQTALDHTKPYTTNGGTTQSIANPALTVNLANADFEAYLYPYEQKLDPGRTMYASDVDNPNVTNMETYFATGARDMVLSPQGKESYAILKVDKNFNLNNIPAYALPTVRTVTATTVLYPQLPTKYIIDAVEIEAIISSDQTPRRLPMAYDSGAASVTGGPYSSQSVIRKTAKIIAGRRVLQDTNNSRNDFGLLNKANPNKDDASFLAQ
ncbi:DUF4876 domain-containing protein [Pedobacter sp. UBA5917]|jgi:hypothetical protein|uniref:DUF4876 domain-containing protein n=1 Tax=Pedobacter sp. UBA5917 TaxID=1947061 RepID=UPI0025D38441|nr:DUF4876 domain-containing protein [Pedobacter sp. UBA5917]